MDVIETVHPADAVPDRDDRTHLGHVAWRSVPLILSTDDLSNLAALICIRLPYSCPVARPVLQLTDERAIEHFDPD